MASDGPTGRAAQDHRCQGSTGPRPCAKAPERRKLSLLLRDATIDDVAGIARVQVDAWRAACAGIVPREVLSSLTYEGSQARLRERLPLPATSGHVMLVAEDRAGCIAGFAWGGPESSGDDGRLGEVYAVYVLPGQQRRGTGRQLLQAAARRLTDLGFTSLRIWVLAADPARGFYERLGGRLEREVEDELRGTRVRKVAYRWDDTHRLATGAVGDAPFVFRDPGRLVDGDLELLLVDRYPGDPDQARAPSYRFFMTLAGRGTPVGRIDLRVGQSRHLCMYAGHIGYEVLPEYRGHHYAARACRLLFPLARSHGLNPLWITCNPDNWASRRTCELAGGTMVEIVDLPTNTDMYLRGERHKCRYRFDL